MKQINHPLLDAADAEIFSLIEVLHQTERRLEELTGGEIDSVTDHDGSQIMLRRAQEHLRQNNALKQAAILDALPANIALLDTQGDILSVNQAWQNFASANAFQGGHHGIGINYLNICDSAEGEGADDARQAAAGIRKVFDGAVSSFSMEYACHSPTEKRWYLLTVNPLVVEHANRAVMMHMNITEQKKADRRIVYLSRVYATLSGINTLIVRATNRGELFRDACRIAVEAGAFRMAWIGEVDPHTLDGKVVAWYGGEQRYVDNIRLTAHAGTPYSELPFCRALRKSQPVICNDTSNDLSVASVREELISRGHKAAGYFPLMVGGRTVGVLALFAGEVNVFDEEETRLLLELADDLSFAIDHIEKQEHINYLAYYDVLTGLANRTLFLERLQQYRRNAIDGDHKLAIFLIDLERFRNINDSLGRVAGDVLLQQVAEWLKQKTGDASMLARVNADVFALVLPLLKEKAEAVLFLEIALEAFSVHPFRLNGAVFRIAFKAGIVLFPEDGADVDTLFKNAEVALKKAKASGEHYLFYEQKMADAVAGKLALENQLREALDKGEFVLYYQPKIDLVSGKLTSAEALIRWNDPRTGLVPPGRFIPILEETGLIYQVGRWALRQAVSDFLRWRSAGLNTIPIAVNVSPLQLRNRAFISEIRQIISIDENAATGLELEITESLIMEDVNHSIASLQAIRDMGVSIAIDDFGTGFSSLSYLSKLPVNTLKIDRSFVINMTLGPEGMALVSTIISLAHAFKLKVVAEGVETEEQSHLLHLLGCDEMQGYLVSRPVPSEKFEERFLASKL